MMRGSLLLLACLAALAPPAGAGGLGSRLLVGRWSPRYTPQPVKFEERRGSFILASRGGGGLGSRLLTGRWSPRYTPKPATFEERHGSFILASRGGGGLGSFIVTRRWSPRYALPLTRRDRNDARLRGGIISGMDASFDEEAAEELQQIEKKAEEGLHWMVVHVHAMWAAVLACLAPVLRVWASEGGAFRRPYDAPHARRLMPEEARSEEASDPKRFGWVPGIATTPRDAPPPAAAMV